MAGIMVNTYFQFQAHIFSNNKGITKCQFLHNNDDYNADAKVIAIPQVFSQNSRDNKIYLISSTSSGIKLATSIFSK